MVRSWPELEITEELVAALLDRRARTLPKPVEDGVRAEAAKGAQRGGQDIAAVDGPLLGPRSLADQPPDGIFLKGV